MKTLAKLGISFLSLILTACFSVPNIAPVIENSREPIKAKVTQSSKKTAIKNNANIKDWRPESYTVKKGDTLYSIGLEFGYDYKEIAQNNNINTPYSIRVGQQLKIKNINGYKPSEANNDAVIIKPLINNQITPSQNSNASLADIPLLNSPKALREPYTEQAANINTTPTKAAETKVPEIKPTESKPSDSIPASEDGMDWGAPTKGKIRTGFNAGASAKGIDIEGVMGQDVNAAGNGKVIYNGSDLRGYGNLVIVKHNKDYLSVYAHNSKILVKEGQTVVKGQKIAEMGNSSTDGVKLHFEIRYQGKSIDPTKLLPDL